MSLGFILQTEEDGETEVEIYRWTFEGGSLNSISHPFRPTFFTVTYGSGKKLL